MHEWRSLYDIDAPSIGIETEGADVEHTRPDGSIDNRPFALVVGARVRSSAYAHLRTWQRFSPGCENRAAEAPFASPHAARRLRW